MSMVNIYKDDMVAIADDTQVADMVAAGWSTEPPSVKEEVVVGSAPAAEAVVPKKRKIGGE